MSLTFEPDCARITVARHPKEEVLKILIKHNYFSDQVQSFGYIPDGKEKSVMSVGMIEGGARHDFGVIDRHEEIRVITGGITINGQLWCNNSGAFMVEPGTQVIFEAADEYRVSTYRCSFPKETR